MNKKLLLLLVVIWGLHACKSVKPIPQSFDASTISVFHSATRAYLKGDYETSKKTLLQLIQKAPNHSASYYLLAKINMVQKNYVELKKNLTLATQYDPTNEYYVSELAFIHSQSGEFKQAASLFMTLVERANPNPIHYYGAYENYLKARAFSKALDVLNAQEKKMGRTPTTALQRFNTLMVMGKEKAAESYVTEVYTAFPNDPLFLSTLIDFYLEKGNTQKAIPLLKNLCETDPENGMAKWLYGQFLLHSPDSLNSYSLLKDAVALNGPTIEQKSSFLLELQQRLGCTNETREITESFVNANPTELVGFTLLGDLYVQCNEIEKAQLAYAKALEINPNAYPIWQQRLYLLFSEEQWEVLNHESEQCIELFPMQAFPYLTSGIAKNKLGSSALAVKTLTTGLNYVTGKTNLKTEFLFQLALARASEGNVPSAIASFNKAFALDPDNLAMKIDALTAIIDNKQFLAFNDSLISACNKLGTSELKVKALEGRLYYVTQQHEKALTHLTSVMEEGCYWPFVFQWIGDCHAKLGNEHSATLFWRKAKEAEEKNHGMRKFEKIPK
jgi:tetratricopeptide (TPR) repeat protein